MCVNLQNMLEAALFSGKIYTADNNFTRPPVATNSKSGGRTDGMDGMGWMVIIGRR